MSGYTVEIELLEHTAQKKPKRHSSNGNSSGNSNSNDNNNNDNNDYSSSRVGGGVGRNQSKKQQRQQLPSAHLISGIVLATVFAIIAAILFIVGIVLLCVWLIAGIVGYETAFHTKGPTQCERLSRGNTPSRFGYYSNCPTLRNDPSLVSFFKHFFIPEKNWRQITFTTRAEPENRLSAADAKLSAYLITQDGSSVPSDHPWIIVVHGIRVCKSNYAALLPAGMLWHSGYNVMVVDLRNHGNSSHVDWYSSFGSQEHFDVLGAFDYLAAEYPGAPIGVAGQSMGGTTAMIAFARESRFKAAFIDSGVCDVRRTLVANADRMMGWGEFIVSSTCFIGISKANGCAPFEFSPVEVLKKDTSKRPIFFEHGQDDQVVPIFNAELCSAIAEQSGRPVFRHYSNVPYEDCEESHILTIVADHKAYEDRLIGFFKQYIPTTP